MDHNLSNSVEPNEENFPEGLDGDGQESLVHFSKEEAKVYDLIQGGMHLDKELEIRSYKPFGQLLKDKDFQQLVIAILSEEKSGLENVPELHQAMQVGEQMIHSEETPFEPAPGDQNPVVMEISEKGKGAGAGKDTIVVMMPGNVLLLTGMIRGEIPINPATGFPEFWVKKLAKQISRGFQGAFKSNTYKSVVRVGATIAGAVMGGPLGAMAGSAAGSALTGRKTNDWLGVAGKAGLYTGAAQLAAPYIPGLGAAGSAMAGSSIPGSGAMGGYLSNAAKAPNMATSLGLGSMMGGQGGAQAAGAAGAASTPQSMFAGLASNPMMQLAPAALNVGAAALANKGAKEQYENELKERNRQMHDDRELEERLKRESGFHEGYKKDNVKKRAVNPRWEQPGEPYFVYEGDDAYNDRMTGRHLAHHAHGGVVKKKKVPLRKGILIKGPGTGQDDLIHTNSEEGAFILDASTVANIGDGSSEAGAERFSEFLHRLKRNMMPAGERRHADLQEMKFGKKEIPVALSRDEIYLNRDNVCKIGFGDHQEGVKRLNEFVKNIREHKSSHGHKLPPKAKNIEEYMRD